MKEKMSAFAIFIFFLIMLGAFGLFMYIFAWDGDVNEIEISRNTRILGIESANDIDNNFVEPEDITYIQDDILNDELEQAVSNFDNPSGVYTIKIPKLDLENEIDHTNDLETLKELGWLILPWTYEYQDSWLRFPPWKEREPKTEAIIICYRRFYGSSHSKSCYDLDKLEIEDEIHFDNSIYSIERKVILTKDDLAIFEPSGDEEYLKLITNSGSDFDAEKNTHYLVLLAKKQIETSESDE